MKIKHDWLLGGLAFLGWAFIFTVIYAQSPLYTSNQNQYFLHGLARAGLGFLNRDWLANTLDPAPVFSGLIYLTHIIFHSGIPFYVYYGLLLGVYLFSMYGIMDTLFDLRRSKTRAISFLALFLVFHSAALRYLLSRIVDADSVFLFEGGVANQRILGQVFQPSAFGVFLVLSIYLFLRGRRTWAILPLALAVYFHPTYLLSAALLTLAYLWLIFRDKRSLKTPALFGLAALAAVLPVVGYTLLVFGPTEAETYHRAQDILVHFRIPHHADISVWLNWTVAVQAAITVAALVVIRKTRLFPIYITLLSGSFLLTILQVATASNALALLFPWRVSVIAVPLGASLLSALIITKVFDAWKASSRAERWIRAASLVLIAGLVLVGGTRANIEAARQISDPARPMMAYVAASKTGYNTYLIPPKMEDFRLVTGAPVFADFKSIPYLDTDVLEWYRRIQFVNAFYSNENKPCKALQKFSAEGVTHIVLETSSPAAACPSLEAVYQDNDYSVYLIRP